MIDRTDTRLIWIDPNQAHNGIGSFDAPYASLELALGSVQPGHTIVLKGGTYEGSSTIQISGAIESPIVILGDDQSEVVINAGCWYLYDASDLVISNITFRDCPQGALSVVGRCRRNRFSGLRFFNCGTENTTSSTLFFGGSGAQCNVVEQCYFEHAPRISGETAVSISGDLEKVSIGLMLSEGDANRPADLGEEAGTDFDPNTDFVIRRNAFVNYDYGMLLGSSPRIDCEYGHVVEYNLVASCTHGIVVHGGDTTLRGNTVKACSGDSIALLAGRNSLVEDNRIIDCGRGIRLRGLCHSVINNCCIRCSEMGVRLETAAETQGLEACGIVVEQNTFTECGQEIVVLQDRTSGVIRNNLAYNRSAAHFIAPASAALAMASNFLIEQNGVAGKTVGAKSVALDFADAVNDDYTTQHTMGAHGWMVKPKPYDPDALESSPQVGARELALAAQTLRARTLAPETDSPVDNDDDNEDESLLEQSFFFNHDPYEDRSDEE